MSGHSKWHNIQKTKGAQDAKRAAAFTKIAKELIVAVKEGGGITDPANNSRLATVITKAKAANMPNDNIKRCLEKAAGGGGGDSYETITYEGYGPGGVAVIVETMTDNRTYIDYNYVLSVAGIPYLADTYGYDCFVRTLEKAEEEHQRIDPLLRGYFTLNMNLEQVDLLSIEEVRRRSEHFTEKCRNKN